MNDFKWQINYVRAIKYLLSWYQLLAKFNAVMCAKYHIRPLLTWFIRANIVISSTVVSGQRPRLTRPRFSVRCVIFRWYYIKEYCKCCLIATAMKFYTHNFIEYIYKEIKNYCWLLLITGLNLKSNRSRPIVSPYVAVFTFIFPASVSAHWCCRFFNVQFSSDFTDVRIDPTTC